jgi:hypothetical protein
LGGDAKGKQDLIVQNKEQTFLLDRQTIVEEQCVGETQSGSCFGVDDKANTIRVKEDQATGREQRKAEQVCSDKNNRDSMMRYRKTRAEKGVMKFRK